MKRFALVCVALCSVFSTGAVAGEWEFVGAVDNFFPSDDLWDSYAIGGELKGVYWATPQWGIAVAGGYTNWDVDSNTTVVSDVVTTELSGDVTYIPLGASVLARLGADSRSRLSFLLEAGVRYMFCDSDADITRTTIRELDPPLVEREEFDCDDGIVARIGGGIEWAMSNSYRPMKLLLTGGYQFDLDQGEATEDRWDTSVDLELNAFFVEIGLVIPIR
jgi:hypothetical protein